MGYLYKQGDQLVFLSVYSVNIIPVVYVVKTLSASVGGNDRKLAMKGSRTERQRDSGVDVCE